MTEQKRQSKVYFDDQLLSEFMLRFYGYGNYDGNYWFIGMEEGGGNSFDDVTKRLMVWAERGKHELEDVSNYHTEMEVTHLFGDKPKLQRTWNKLIRAYLSMQRQVPTTEQVRAYQGKFFGRSNGSTCLLELLPLPSPSTNHWLYGQHSRLPYLKNRDAYKEFCVKPRVANLRRRLKQHRPRAVVFYGLSYLSEWQAIAETDFLPSANGLLTGQNGSMIFVVTKHQVAKGVTNDYFHQVGNLVSGSAMK